MYNSTRFLESARKELTMFDFSILTEKTVILGILSKNYILFNHILIIAKKTIYLNRCKLVKPNFSNFMSLLIKSYKMEKYIAIRNDKEAAHDSRWQGMAQWISAVR